MQSLNAASVRQCHPTAPPLQQAMDMPHNTKKSTLDAWNGFHSISCNYNTKEDIVAESGFKLALLGLHMQGVNAPLPHQPTGVLIQPQQQQVQPQPHTERIQKQS